MLVTLIVPVFNDIDALEELALRIKGVVAVCNAKFEFVVVDDGSSLLVWNRLNNLSFGDVFESITLVRLSRNYGQQAATLQGLLLAEGDYLVTMDSDLQHAPEDIPKLLKEAEKGFDIVYGQYRGVHDCWRRISSHTCRLLTTPMGSLLYYASSFRCIERSAFGEYVKPYSLSFVSIDEAADFLLRSVSRVPVSHEERKYNHSSYDLIALARQLIRSFIYTKHLPRGLVVTGLGMISLGFLAFSPYSIIDGALWLGACSLLGLFMVVVGIILKFPWKFREPGRGVVISEVISHRKSQFKE